MPRNPFSLRAPHRLRTAALLGLVHASPAAAQPTGRHPRLLLDDARTARLAALAAAPGSATAASVGRCAFVRANPAEFRDTGYQGFAWLEAMGACLVSWKATGDDADRATAALYWHALLEDRTTIGDCLGPSTNGDRGIVTQDTGYSMRTHGVYGALGYDWLHDTLSASERRAARDTFRQWLAFHADPDTYMRAEPGANYHAGHVLAVTFLAVTQADAMNTDVAGSGAALWDEVVGTMWGQVMAGGYGPRGVLVGGDWLEGWQYAPLSIVSYAMAGRALADHGVAVPFLADYLADVVMRYHHALLPSDRMVVGGDTSEATPSLEPNVLPLLAAELSVASPTVAGWARAERERLALPVSRDFRRFHEVLAELEDVTPAPYDRDRAPRTFHAVGAGTVYTRTGFDRDASVLVSACKGIVVDHQHQDAGNLLLSRGADELLVDPSPYGSLSTLTGNAPTMAQPHFLATYRPSQGPFGERYGAPSVPAADATQVRFAVETVSGLAASRCDYAAQFRFRDVPSPGLDGAVRDVVFLPGDDGATVLVVDRVHTSAAYDGAPLGVRFRLAGAATEHTGYAETTVGSSRLTLERLTPGTAQALEPVPVGDCTGDRGACIHGRFAATEWRAELPGPHPFGVHVLAAGPLGGSDEPSSLVLDSGTYVAWVRRDGKNLAVVGHSASGEVTAYDAATTPARHVVLDAPGTGPLRVDAAPTQAGGCRITLTPDSSGSAFAERPVVFTTDPACAVAVDARELPNGPPPLDGGVRPDGGGASGDAGPADGGARPGAGCSCDAVGVPRTHRGVLAVGLYAWPLLRAFRRRRDRIR